MSVVKKIVIREATVSDAKAVTEVMLTSRKQLLAFAPLAHSDEAVFQWIEGYLIPKGRVTVALLESQIVGICAMSEQDEVGWIDQLYLLPKHTGNGIGSILVSEALDHFEGRPVQLVTFQQNHRSRAFYERFGFSAVKFNDGTNNEEGVPDVLYQKLPSS